MSADAYFVSYINSEGIANYLIKEHPLDWIEREVGRSLISWKAISLEEYEKYKNKFQDIEPL